VVVGPIPLVVVVVDDSIPGIRTIRTTTTTTRVKALCRRHLLPAVTGVLLVDGIPEGLSATTTTTTRARRMVPKGRGTMGLGEMESLSSRGEVVRRLTWRDDVKRGRIERLNVNKRLWHLHL
jgi:hypothetical protein